MTIIDRSHAEMTTTPSLQPPRSSRERLLEAAKTLMAELGYEQASTVVMARRAGTSESQLIRNFDSKAGLLEAIFEESWKPLNSHIRSISTEAAPKALAQVLGTFIQALEHDPELATLFLFESRRVRGPRHEIALSDGYFEFMDLLHQMVRRGQREGSLTASLHPEVLVSALFGAAEGMVRERLLRGPPRGSATYSNNDIRKVFEALLAGLSPKSRARSR